MSKIIPQLKVDSVTILNGATTSSAIDQLRHVITGIEFPAAMTGTGVTFQVSQDNTNWVDSTVSAITKTNSSLVQVGSTYRSLEGLGRYLRLKSSGAEGADRVFKIYSVPM